MEFTLGGSGPLCLIKPTKRRRILASTAAASIATPSHTALRVKHLLHLGTHLLLDGEDGVRLVRQIRHNVVD